MANRSKPRSTPISADTVPKVMDNFLPGEKNVPRSKRVFTNRNLRMESVRAIGFDMDHTLALYNRETFEPLTFSMAMENLIADRGYPEEIRELQYDPDFTIRGLIVDKRFGNLLKMDFHNYIARAYHGFTPLDGDQRRRRYRNSRVNLRSGRYTSFDTFFSMPEGSLFAALVDLKSRHGRGGSMGSIPVKRIYDDVRDCVDKIHRDGSLKKVIMADLARYFIVDEDLRATLQRFRMRGKKLFLVTNSEYEYTEAVLSFLLDQPGKSWRDLFDLVIASSRKPGFFVDDAPPTPVQDPEGEHQGLFEGGNAAFAEEFLGASAGEVLYFGDHTYGDILRSKKTVGWRTALIVHELEGEIFANEGCAYALQEIEDLTERRMALDRDRDQIDLLLHVLERIHKKSKSGAQERSSGLPPWAKDYTRHEMEEFVLCDPEEQERRLKRLRSMSEGLDFLLEQTVARSAELSRRVSDTHNRIWGPTFREANELSRFGRQVREFACIYTSRSSNFLHYPVNYYFIAPAERMAHEI